MIGNLAAQSRSQVLTLTHMWLMTFYTKGNSGSKSQGIRDHDVSYIILLSRRNYSNFQHFFLQPIPPSMHTSTYHTEQTRPL